MTLYALINRNLTDTGKRSNTAPTDQADDIAPNKPYWVPIVEEITDTSTQGSEKVISPWVDTVEIDRFLRERTIRNKTVSELDVDDTNRINNLFTASNIDRALAQVLFRVVNDVRALEEKSSISVTQFKDYLKSFVR